MRIYDVMNGGPYFLASFWINMDLGPSGSVDLKEISFFFFYFFLVLLERFDFHYCFLTFLPI